jgi:hypothetical protein
LLLVAVAVAACGGEDSIPLSEYVERAERICRENETENAAELAKLRRELEDDGDFSPDDIVKVNRRALELVRPGVEELAALPAPDEHADAAADYERASHEAIDAMQDVVDAYDDADAEGIKDATARNRAAVADNKKAAAEFGLDGC